MIKRNFIFLGEQDNCNKFSDKFAFARSDVKCAERSTTRIKTNDTTVS